MPGLRHRTNALSVLVLVPARGGSKAVPGKNLRLVGGLSLTARAVLHGRLFLIDARLADGLVVVDTDDTVIADEGRRFGAEAPFLRPPELARDETPTIDSVLHCLDRLQAAGRTFETIVLLQPTSPLRTSADITACWRTFDPAQAPSVVAVTPIEHPLELAVGLDRDNVLSGESPTVRRRQEFTPSFRITGAAYVTTFNVLRNRRAFVVHGLTRGVVVPSERSLDIDTAADLEAADALLRGGPIPAGLAIGGRQLGGGARCYVIAEAGVNHNGDPSLAHRLVDVAADAGADAVKFQTFIPEQLAAPHAKQAAYQTENTGFEDSQLAMLRRLVLPRDVYPALKDHAEDRGIAFLSTPFDEASADFLESLGIAAFKISSGELTNLPFITHVARKGRPMLLSSGMGTMAEVAEAVLAVRHASDVPLALFHCVTNYPATPEQCNLGAMASMRSAFHVPVGWSDHTSGIDVSTAAVALGADVLEKHFTLDRGLAGPDHKASLEPKELSALLRSVRAVEAARGTGVKAPVAVENDLATKVRKSLHARWALAAGHTLAAEDVIALRPGDGLSPAALQRLLGRRLRAAVAAGAQLDERDFA